MTYFDPKEGARLRDIGIDRAEKAHRYWVKTADSALVTVARVCGEFTADQVWEKLDSWKTPQPEDPRAMGAVFVRASKAGTITRTDRTIRSQRPAHHRYPCTVWRSTLGPARAPASAVCNLEAVFGAGEPPA